MSSQHVSLLLSHFTTRPREVSDIQPTASSSLPTSPDRGGGTPPHFWHDRLIEGGLILSMALYYIVGNQNITLPLGGITHVDPLISLPFLLLFAFLAWYRLPFAIALLPLSLPYYLLQKTVFSDYRFSLAEITLWTCVAVAVGQIVYKRRRWPYWLSWSQLRERIGPFVFPILLFVVMACVSIFIAYSRKDALRAFREEVFDPLLFLGLVLCCFRSWQDVTRLLVALLGTGLMIAIIGLAQYLVFRDVGRITAVYGSANDVGLLFDYVLPIGLALLLSRLSWKIRLSALVVCIPMGIVLLLSDSRGSWQVAIPLAMLFLVVFTIRSRKVLLIGAMVCVLLGAGIVALYHNRIYNYVLDGHTNAQGQSTITKRFYLWETALDMIHDSPWLGYGMDNWLCHYSNSWTNPCLYTQPQPKHYDQNGQVQTLNPNQKVHAYWILYDPVAHKSTGLSEEPTLSHPHNILLQIWVSIGLFGLLAFLALLLLFAWLFARTLLYLQRKQGDGHEQLRWMMLAVGAAMLAALAQGMGDSSFLEQDLSFCFWSLVAVLLVIRVLSGMSWADLFPRKRHLMDSADQTHV